jgi:endonuclease/exonuclease/phosphatase (EEP) superfamily protein YafD
VGLQELDPEDAALISTDASLVAAYPYRELHPEEGPFGSGLLSAFPITESGWLEASNSAWARLDIGDGRSLVAVTAHPPPGRLGLPSVFDPSARDAGIRELRAELVDDVLARGEPLILFGDFNVTDREPAYDELAAGLRDLHAEVGLGPGSTWRPPSLEWLPFGVLRIDHVFVGPGVQPASISADCAPRGSDHCLLRASVRV